ncbi:hypothetical protein Tco_1295537 [Tanacetum coccineum]
MMRYGLLRILWGRQSKLTPNIPETKPLYVGTVHWNSWGDEVHLRRQGATSQEQPVPLGGKKQPVRSRQSPQEARSNTVSIIACTLTTDLRAEGDALISKGPAAESHS